jgi:hypothetical protein
LAIIASSTVPPGAALHHLFDPRADLVGADALDQVPRRSGLHRLVHLLLVVERGEDQDFGAQARALHPAGDLDAVDAG